MSLPKSSFAQQFWHPFLQSSACKLTTRQSLSIFGYKQFISPTILSTCNNLLISRIIPCNVCFFSLVLKTFTFDLRYPNIHCHGKSGFVDEDFFRILHGFCNYPRQDGCKLILDLFHYQLPSFDFCNFSYSHACTFIVEVCAPILVNKYYLALPHIAILTM